MAHSALAWVMRPGNSNGLHQLHQEEVSFSPVEPDEVLAQPMYGSWEANMLHALEGKPLNLFHARHEPAIVLGNAVVVRVLECGGDVTVISPGRYAIIFPPMVEDQWGYCIKGLGFDGPGTSGGLSTLMKVASSQILPIPGNTRHSLAQWAMFPVRYMTAWSNWHMAYGTFRLQVPREEWPRPHVWGWGGGTTLAELDLARRQGCRCAMLSGADRNLELIARHGIVPVDRRQFADLCYDEERYANDNDFRVRYKRSERLFLNEVKRLTNDEMVNIFVDYIGTPVYRATMRALSREGVITTAGWRGGMELTHVRASECISRHQHINTHFAPYKQCREAMEYAERTGWIPDPPDRIYRFEEIPQLAEDYAAGRTGYFSCYQVCS